MLEDCADLRPKRRLQQPPLFLRSQSRGYGLYVAVANAIGKVPNAVEFLKPGKNATRDVAYEIFDLIISI
jgi:hypothetical protein